MISYPTDNAFASNSNSSLINAMGRKKNDSGSGWAIGLIVLGFLLYANPGIAILLAVAGVAIYCFFAWDSTGKSKTVTHSKTFFGNRKRTTEYHDTGKVVEQVSSPTWTGGTKRETKVVRPGQRASTSNDGGYRRGTRPQTCRKCNESVSGVEGRYVCSCGNRWGRP